MWPVTSERLVSVGHALSDRTRVGLLTALLDGRAYTVTELARHTGVAVSTASEHLTVLRTADLVALEPSGRHRYYRLTGARTAQMLESLGARPTPVPPARRIPVGLELARTCYDHMAGAIAVALYDWCQGAGHLEHRDGSALHLTRAGREFFGRFGIDLGEPPWGTLSTPSGRPLARRCLDWTERRAHLGGRLGAGLLSVMLAQGWVVRGSRPRALRLTRTGQQQLPQRFPGLSLDAVRR